MSAIISKRDKKQVLNLRNLLDLIFRHLGTYNPFGRRRSQKVVPESIQNFGLSLCDSICKLQHLSKMKLGKTFKKAMHRIHYEHSGRIPVWKVP